jgi:NADH-quinone oxidoreductase subunit H
MILISMLAATMFMGGWLSPFEGTFLAPMFDWVPGLIWLLAKTSFFLFVYLWIRATFPRYRYDQIMRLGWKIFIPVTLVWLVVVATAQVFDIGPWFTETAALAAGGA